MSDKKSSDKQSQRFRLATSRLASYNSQNRQTAAWWVEKNVARKSKFSWRGATAPSLPRRHCMQAKAIADSFSFIAQSTFITSDKCQGIKAKTKHSGLRSRPRPQCFVLTVQTTALNDPIHACLVSSLELQLGLNVFTIVQYISIQFYVHYYTCM